MEKGETISNVTMLIAVIGLIGAVIVMAILLGSEREDGMMENTLMSSGTASVLTEPDEVKLYIFIETTKPTAQEALTENSGLSKAVIASLTAQGIKETDIETSSFYLNAKQDWDPEAQKSIQTGYILTHTMQIKTGDTKNVGKYLDAAMTAGANGVSNIEFGLSKEKEKEIKQQAIAKATVAAKEKAVSMANNLGITLGEITSVSEYSGFGPIYYANNYMKLDSANSGSVADAYISPNTIEVQSDVSLSYEIEDD